MGPIETEVRDDIEALGDLDGMDPSLAALCYSHAAFLDEIDSGRAPEEDNRQRAAVSKELRAALAQLFANHANMKEDGLDLGLST